MNVRAATDRPSLERRRGAARAALVRPPATGHAGTVRTPTMDADGARKRRPRRRRRALTRNPGQGRRVRRLARTGGCAPRALAPAPTGSSVVPGARRRPLASARPRAKLPRRLFRTRRAPSSLRRTTSGDRGESRERRPRLVPHRTRCGRHHRVRTSRGGPRASRDDSSSTTASSAASRGRRPCRARAPPPEPRRWSAPPLVAQRSAPLGRVAARTKLYKSGESDAFVHADNWRRLVDELADLPSGRIARAPAAAASARRADRRRVGARDAAAERLDGAWDRRGVPVVRPRRRPLRRPDAASSRRRASRRRRGLKNQYGPCPRLVRRGRALDHARRRARSETARSPSRSQTRSGARVSPISTSTIVNFPCETRRRSPPAAAVSAAARATRTATSTARTSTPSRSPRASLDPAVRVTTRRVRRHSDRRSARAARGRDR